MPPADPILQAFLIATAQEEWEEWYVTTRLVFADWLDEHSNRDYRAWGVVVRAWHVSGDAGFWVVTPGMQRIHYRVEDAQRELRRRVLDLFREVIVQGRPAPDLLPRDNSPARSAAT